MIQLPAEQVDQIVKSALAEDMGTGDITSNVLIPKNLQSKSYMLVKQAGIIAGTVVAEKVFQQIDPDLSIQILINDGEEVVDGDVAMLISGRVRSILGGERVALNFLQRLSGIATTTAQYVEKVSGLDVDIADTRKTTPGLRLLEKYAVKMGGGRNHRFDLGDAVLIKDNHIAALRSLGMTYKEIVIKAKQNAPSGIKIEAEATTIQEALEAVEAGVDIVMLDNMSIRDMAQAAKEIAGRAEVEASGGISLKTVRSVAETGVDFISVGALTHSYNSLDISLELETNALKMF